MIVYMTEMAEMPANCADCPLLELPGRTETH